MQLTIFGRKGKRWRGLDLRSSYATSSYVCMTPEGDHDLSLHAVLRHITSLFQGSNDSLSCQARPDGADIELPTKLRVLLVDRFRSLFALKTRVNQDIQDRAFLKQVWLKLSPDRALNHWILQGGLTVIWLLRLTENETPDPWNCRRYKFNHDWFSSREQPGSGSSSHHCQINTSGYPGFHTSH